MLSPFLICVVRRVICPSVCNIAIVEVGGGVVAVVVVNITPSCTKLFLCQHLWEEAAIVSEKNVHVAPSTCQLSTSRAST